MDRPVGKRFHPRAQGDLGEAAAIAWFTRVGVRVSAPLFHSPDYDLVAELDGVLQRVQVKTSTCRDRGRFCVRVATSGGNQSWNGVIKHFDASRCDALFVLTGDGRRWLIPSHAVEGTSSITLGGVKYSEFEVDPEGATAFAISDRSKIESGRGSAGVGEPGSAVNRVPRAEGVRFPPPPLPVHGLRPTETNRHTGARTILSKHHQVTIPKSQFEAAELREGDRFRVMAMGPGRVELTRVDKLAGQLALEASD